MIKNRKAYHDFEIIETYEAGMVLVAGEVKALKMNKASLKEAFVSVIKGEAYLKNSHFSIPEYISFDRPDEKRDKKLLLKKKEILKIEEKVKLQNLTVIPLEIYKSRHLFKIKIALARGLKKYDKREKLKKKQEDLKVRRELKKILF